MFGSWFITLTVSLVFVFSFGRSIWQVHRQILRDRDTQRVRQRKITRETGTEKGRWWSGGRGKGGRVSRRQRLKKGDTYRNRQKKHSDAYWFEREGATGLGRVFFGHECISDTGLKACTAVLYVQHRGGGLTGVNR